jgi:hypothetical protein
MPQECFPRVVFAFELLLGQVGMDRLVAWPADHQQLLSDLPAVELALVLPVTVARARNQVVFG